MIEQHKADRSDREGKLAYMDNTALLDVFFSDSSPTSNGAEEGGEEGVSVLGKEAVLGPGDLLVMPPKWWHAFKSLEASCSVSMWY